MKLVARASVFTLFFVILYIFLVGYDFTNHFKSIGSNISDKNVNSYAFEAQSDLAFIEKLSSKPKKITVALSVVVCGDRIQETLVMIKSAIVFSRKCNLHVIIITETGLIENFEETLSEWKNDKNASFTFETHPVSFPESQVDEWKKLFKPCASQRLFLPSVLKNVDAVLYVDTDVLFLSPLDEIWDHFSKMNSTQLAALSPEHEDRNTGWYNRFARHPYYGELGVNSGVMLMNLTRMRSFGWERYLLPILHEYKLKMTWGDQDIINIIFHFHPERLYIYDCSYNYRSDHCMYMSVCRAAEKTGVRVLHGSRGTFHSDKQPAIKAIFSAFEQYHLGSDVYQYLVLPMETFLKLSPDSNCGKVSNIFLKQISDYVKQDDYFNQ